MTVALFSLAGLALAAAATAPLTEQERAARPVAGCEVAASKQQSRSKRGGEDELRFREIAGYWRSELERVEPDAKRRDELRKGARTALEKDLRAIGPMNAGVQLGMIMSACIEERIRRESRS